MVVNGHKSKPLLKNLHPFPSTLCYVSVVLRHIHKERMTQNVRISLVPGRCPVLTLGV